MQHLIPLALGQSEAIIVLVADAVMVYHCANIDAIDVKYIYIVTISHL